MDRSQVAGIAAAILLVALVGLGLSLTLPLLSLEMERMGVSGTLIGVNTAIAGLASIVAVPFVPRLAARFGVGPLLALAVVVAALAFLSFRIVYWFPAWFPLRFVFSVALGTLFVLSEFWIASAAPPERRGFVMGIYATVLALGFAAGPALLGLVGTTGWAPYLAGTPIFLVAALPLLLARRHLPKLDAAPHRPLAGYVTALPMATAAACAFGAIETGAFALLPIYGVRSGLDAATASFLISAVALGNVLFQLPLGLLADRMSKARLLLAITVIGIAGALGIPLAADFGLSALFVLLFVWGGIVGALYTVGLAHLASRFSGSDLAGANAAFVLLYNIGLAAGPPLIGLSLDISTRWGVSLATAGFLSLLLAAAALRRQ